MNTLVTLLVRKRRLFELLAARVMLANQQVTFLTDGADDVRDLPLYLNPQAEHLLDWFHVTMRLTVLTHEIYSALAYDDDCPACSTSRAWPSAPSCSTAGPRPTR